MYQKTDYLLDLPRKQISQNRFSYSKRWARVDMEILDVFESKSGQKVNGHFPIEWCSNCRGLERHKFKHYS